MTCRFTVADVYGCPLETVSRRNRMQGSNGRIRWCRRGCLVGRTQGIPFKGPLGPLASHVGVAHTVAVHDALSLPFPPEK